MEEHFENICTALKKYRITAATLIMDSTHRQTNLSKEQCVTLFKILKPSILTINSIGSNRFEALLYSKGLVKFIPSTVYLLF